MHCVFRICKACILPSESKLGKMNLCLLASVETSKHLFTFVKYLSHMTEEFGEGIKRDTFVLHLCNI